MKKMCLSHGQERRQHGGHAVGPAPPLSSTAQPLLAAKGTRENWESLGNMLKIFLEENWRWCNFSKFFFLLALRKKPPSIAVTL